MSKPQPTHSKTLGLPPYMEARPMKRGGYTYRVQMDDGTKVSLGWNLQEALTEYQRLRGRFQDHTQSATEILNRHRKGARQRDIEFCLTVDDVRNMLDSQAGRCAMTQRQFSNDRPTGQRIRPWAASIDRIDSSKGYERSNCRLVCASVNIAMNKFGDGSFTEILEALVRRVVRDELAAILATYSHADLARSPAVPKNQNYADPE